MLRYPLRLKLGAAAALLFFASALVVVGLAAWRQEVLHQGVVGDAAWYTHKLDRDIVQLRSDVALEAGSAETLDSLRLRFDMIYSRVSLMQFSDVNQVLQQAPHASRLLSNLSVLMDDMDGLLAEIHQLGQGERWILSDRLERISRLTEQLLVAVDGHLAESAMQGREALQTLYAVLLALILAMSLAALMVVIFLVREAREHAEARRSLESLSRELQATAHRAEAASQAKSEFLATVSHEIRTPLNGVIGMSDLLVEQPIDAQSREYARTLSVSAARLLELINDILDFSKIESGKMEFERRPVRLAALIDEACRLFEPRAEAKGLQLNAHIAPELPERVLGDPARLRQVLLNLLSNAIKFTEQGQVSVEASLNPQGNLRLDVCDSGPGIEKEKHEWLFQPFRQADASTARRYGGTGLGLAISRRLAEAMGGTIGLESRPGEGSRFWVELPLEATAAEEPEPLAPQSVPEYRVAGRVLLVEDNPVNQQVAVAMLERLGCRVSVVESGARALELTRDETFDLIFMDVQMPDMDGLETTRRLREAGGWRAEVPIVAMTAGGPGAERERCLAAGMSDYLAKPLRRKELLDALRQGLVESAVADSLEEPGASVQILDSAVFDELRESLEPTALATLIKVHGEQLGQHLEGLQTAVQRDDWATVAALAHRIKGESGSLGGRRLAELARRLEQQARSGQRQATDSDLAALQACIPLTLAELEARLEAS